MIKYRRNGLLRESSRRGVAAAEFAVCLPVIVLLVLATTEACTMIFLKQSLTAASYEGVRTALAKSATSADVRAKCEQILKDRRIDGADVSINPADVAALQPGDYVDVTVTAPCGPNSVLPVMFYRGREMSNTASMMIEF